MPLGLEGDGLACDEAASDGAAWLGEDAAFVEELELQAAAMKPHTRRIGNRRLNTSGEFTR